MRRKTLIVAGLTLSVTAWAFPWDNDMVDAAFLRAFEWEMRGLPKDTVSRNRFPTPGTRTSAEGMAMESTLTRIDDNTVVQGEALFDIYCTACHGKGGEGKAPTTDNNPAEDRYRYPIPPPLLAGKSSVTELRTDGYIFLTVRDGGAIMPAYYAQLDEQEIWKIVAYIRTLDGATYALPPEEPEQ